MLLVLVTARWPERGWRFSLMDLRYYGRVWEWADRWKEMTWIDATYMAGLVVAAMVAAGWILRLGLRGYAVMRYRPPAFQRGRFWGRSLLLMLLLSCTVVGIGAGWPNRIGQRWAANVVHGIKSKGIPAYSNVNVVMPLAISGDEELAVIRSVVKQGSDWHARVVGLKLLMEGRGAEASTILADAVRTESDGRVKRLEARLIGLTAGPGSEDLLGKLLCDVDAEAREGAADGMGIWREAAFSPNGHSPFRGPLTIDGDPAIVIPDSAFARPAQQPRAGTRETLEKMMLSGTSLGEREAAARALLNWPPADFQLRYAEWGVFMADSAGKLQFVQEQLDEIPPFVHRVGNPAKELEGRIVLPMVVFKPVIHLTVNEPMVVDLEVCVGEGRPWVVYPKLDDLTLATHSPTWTEIKFAELKADSQEPVGLASVDDLREGYPWLTPKHRTYERGSYPLRRSISAVNQNLLSGIGVRWQSIIVSPKKLEWMQPAEVGGDARFAWWKRLREVDCSWVSSRNESERFLYYDGPSRRSAPVRVSIDDVELTISGVGRNRPGLYIEVNSAGVAMRWIDEADPLKKIAIAGLAQAAPAAEADLTRALEARGLTHSEAAGLVECWTPAFFKTPGRRFLTLMTEEDYDLGCPMTIRPTPTTRVRVGIIWTELGQ